MLTAWTFAPLSVFLVLIVGTAYVAGVRRVRRDGEWPAGRTRWFLSGLGVWVICVCSFIGVYERVLFTDRAVQVVLLLTVVPLFLALGERRQIPRAAGHPPSTSCGPYSATAAPTYPHIPLRARRLTTE